MSDTQGWYQRRIAALRQQAPPPQTYAPQPQHQHYDPNPGYRPQPVQYPQHPQQQQVVDYQPPQQPPKVTIENFYEAMAFWKGGKGHKENAEPCPQCGSANYFTSIQTSKRGPQPAPHCFSCGYNDGMFNQGLQSSWQGAR